MGCDNNHVMLNFPRTNLCVVIGHICPKSTGKLMVQSGETRHIGLRFTSSGSGHNTLRYTPKKFQLPFRFPQQILVVYLVILGSDLPEGKFDESGHIGLSSTS